VVVCSRRYHQAHPQFPLLARHAYSAAVGDFTFTSGAPRFYLDFHPPRTIFPARRNDARTARVTDWNCPNTHDLLNFVYATTNDAG